MIGGPQGGRRRRFGYSAGGGWRFSTRGGAPMAIRPLSREEARSIDEQAEALGLPTLVLMENAGRGAAEWLRERVDHPSRVVVACGPGNNGGDGGVLGRHLDGWGWPVRVVW